MKFPSSRRELRLTVKARKYMEVLTTVICFLAPRTPEAQPRDETSTPPLIPHESPDLRSEKPNVIATREAFGFEIPLVVFLEKIRRVNGGYCVKLRIGMADGARQLCEGGRQTIVLQVFST